MNWLDVLLLLILVWSLAVSFARGFSREAIGLVSAVVGLFAGLWFYGPAGAFLQPYVSSRNIANFCGFAIVFLGVLLAGSLLGWTLGKFLKWAGLSWFDRLLGAVFGFVRALVISIALVTAMVAFTPGFDPPKAVVRSRLAPYVIEAAHVLTSVAPHEMKDEFRKRYEQVKGIWNKALERGSRQMPGTEI